MDPTKELLAASGFDLDWLTRMHQQYGDAVFGVIADLLNQGLTTAWVVQAIERLHPLLLDVLRHVFVSPAAARLGAMSDAAGGAVVAGIMDDIVKGDLGVFMVQKLIELLPSLGLDGYKLWAATAGLKVLLAFLQSKKS